MKLNEKLECSEKGRNLAIQIAAVVEEEKHGYTIVMTAITMIIAGIIETSADPERERKKIFGSLEPLVGVIGKYARTLDEARKTTEPTEH